MDFYKEIGLGNDTFIASASGGDFTERLSHEFQTIVPAGEDTIYIDREKGISYNKEVVSENSEELIRLGHIKLDPKTSRPNPSKIKAKVDSGLNK